MNMAVDWLDRRAKLSPEHVALVDTISDRRITYKQWNAQANQTAHFLREKVGVKKGDRVAVLSTNCVEYMDVWFACQKLGAVLQNLNWRLAVPELEMILNDAKPVALCYSNDFHEQITKIKLRDDIESIGNFIAFGDKVQDVDLRFSERNSYRPTKPEVEEITMDMPWVICYTGGTTGLPKGVILTHKNLTWNAINTVVSWGLSDQDVAILNAPLFHTGGLNVFTAPLVHCGGTSIVCKTFDTDQMFDLVDNERITVFFGVPTMFVMMQNHPRWEKADFSHLKFVVSGGAPCPMPVFEKFWDRGINFKTGYGLTEAGPNTFWLPNEQLRDKPGAVGYPLMHVEIKLVDKFGVEVTEPGVPGELLIRGPHRTPRYWNNPEATSEAIDELGWLHTGDLALKDDDGAFTVVGRAKDMYISGGENVYPAEVESVIHGHESVAEAAMFGVPNEKWGEVGRAVVALKPGEELTSDELIDYLRERIAHYKVPHSVVFVEELPKTAAGKISKKVLKENFGRLEDAA